MVIAYRRSICGIRHHIRRSLILVAGLIALVVPCSAVEYAGGTGEPNDPYLIATAKQSIGTDFGQEGVHYRLVDDIDLWAKVLWCDSFAGHLDGAGYEIRHVTLVDTSSLFGDILPDASIRNLILRYVSVAFPWGRSPYAIGALAYRNRGTITGCGVSGVIASSDADIAGGLVGANEGVITNCWFDGWITNDWEEGDTDPAPTIAPHVGGLVGTNEGTIACSYAKGLVSAKTGVGGLVGTNWPGFDEPDSIADCYAECTVIAENGAGGLVGNNFGRLSYCYSMSRLFGSMAGGLVGMARWDEFSGDVTGCIWSLASGGGGPGVGLDPSAMHKQNAYALNGWVGNPNWVIDGMDTPRLVWENTSGSVIRDSDWPLHYWLDGTGTPQDPYVIKTPQALAALGQYSSLWDKHFILGNDLDFHSQYPFIEPFPFLGVCRGSAFSGTFDGRGHVIRNLSVGRPDGVGYSSPPAWNLGLFGYVTGQIKNLTLENVHLAAGAGSRCAGLLVGMCEGGHLEDCRATGSVTVGESSQYIGGLIGYSSGEISDCGATVEIKTGEGSTDVGAVVGLQSE